MTEVVRERTAAAPAGVQAVDQRPTVALFIPTLGVGGAERQVLELARNLDAAKWRVLLLTIADEASLHDAPNVRAVSLHGAKGVAAVRKLASIIPRERVDILQAFLLGAQVYALAAKLLTRDFKLVAAIRSSMGIDRIVGWKGKVSHSLLFGLRVAVDEYVFNSSAGELALGRKLRDDRKRLIYNGIDTARFHPDAMARAFIREVAGIAADAPVVGVVANVNVDKGYPILVETAAIVAREINDVVFVVVGDYRNALGDEIRRSIDVASLSGHFRFLGVRPDVERLMPGMDVVCSASTSEGFSNTIGEAMACGVPCVVTDVGDGPVIVGETGAVVPPNDPRALAGALVQYLQFDPTVLRKHGAAARMRIEQQFDIRRMVGQYEALYDALLHQRPKGRSR